MAKHLLTDRHVRNAKPKATPYRLFDGDGLALWVSTTGARSWQLRYRLHGKEQTATLGKLERLTLAEARARADDLRKLAADGEHLTTVKRRDRLQRKADAANTFGVVAAGWMAREARRQKWTPDYLGEVAASVRNHLSALDALPIASINAPTVAPLLRKIEARAPMMLEKVRPRLNGILDYAVEHGLITGNPLPAIRRGRKVERAHYPAATKLPEVGAILRSARAADPCKGIARAHLLLAFTAQRVSEVVGATWAEFDWEAQDWAIPRERMKRKELGPRRACRAAGARSAGFAAGMAQGGRRRRGVCLSSPARPRAVDHPGRRGEVLPERARARRQAFAALMALDILDGRTRGRQGRRRC